MAGVKQSGGAVLPAILGLVGALTLLLGGSRHTVLRR